MNVQRPDHCGTIEVALAYSPAPRVVREWRLRLAAGACVADALAASAQLLRREFAALDMNPLAIAIWGRRTSPSQRLVGGERIELCRPLSVDPKTARRERFARQGSRMSGLFVVERGAAKSASGR